MAVSDQLRQTGILAITALAAGGYLSGPAAAQKVCVDCSGPDARYVCSIKDFDKVAKYKSSDKVLAYLCVTELAKQGHHSSCRAGNSYNGACLGIEKLLDPANIGQLPEAPPEKDATSPAGDPNAAHPKTAAKSTSKPPQTLEELAKKSKLDLSGVQDSVDKAGSAVGSAVKNSWRCISSLFKDC